MGSLYKQGDIVWVNLGEVKEVVGHEQAKHRPCIVIKNFGALKLLVVIPMTSKPNSYYTVLKLEPKETGLSADSYVLCHQTRTISQDRITSISGTISTRALNSVKGILIDVFDLK
jgi:mRNA-degrading endonuclease toxin of MazEF toxin-antitoxin module